MYDYASRTTKSEFPAGSLTLNVAGGEPIHVCGIHFSAIGATAPTFLVNNAAGDLLFTVIIPDNSSYNMQTMFIADAGLQIVGEQDTSCAVFHKSPGT